MFAAISRLLSPCLPWLKPLAEDDASVLMISEARSPFYTCIQIDSPNSLLFFRVRLSEQPAGAERGRKTTADLHPTGVVRAYTWERPTSSEAKQTPIRQAVQLATTLPPMRISDLYPLGELPLKAGEHLDGFSTWLVHICVEEMRHRQAVVDGPINATRRKAEGRGRMVKATDNAVLAKSFVAAETARKGVAAADDVALVSIARIVMPRATVGDHGSGWAT